MSDFPWPSDEVMCQFKCIRDCEEFRLIEENGTMAVRINEWDFVMIDGETVDVLTDLKWLEVDGDMWSVTEKGLYRCDQYFKRKKVQA